MNRSNIVTFTSRFGRQVKISQFGTDVLVATSFLVIVLAFASTPAKCLQQLSLISPLPGLFILLTTVTSLAYASIALYLLLPPRTRRLSTLTNCESEVPSFQ